MTEADDLFHDFVYLSLLSGFGVDDIAIAAEVAPDKVRELINDMRADGTLQELYWKEEGGQNGNR